MSEGSKTPQDVLKWEFVDDSMKPGITPLASCAMTTKELSIQAYNAIQIFGTVQTRLIAQEYQINDMKELIAAAAEHDDPKRVLREFIVARPELFGERKP